MNDDVIIYRGLNLESIDSFNPSDPAFKSFTTNINVILNSDDEYLNPNGCCVLRTILSRGMHAYCDDNPIVGEKQYILDKGVQFSEPILFQGHGGDFKLYDVNII